MDRAAEHGAAAARTPILVDGRPACSDGYAAYHRNRIDFTLATLRGIGAKRVVEIGAHPWLMTAAMIDDGRWDICATVSAEEVTRWPEEIEVQCHRVHVQTARGAEAWVVNYSANIERTRFTLHEIPDTVLACEIVEHLIRSPHMMLLNVNRWLPIGGQLLLTTPNGAQFSNPFRRRSPAPAYRSNAYERHAYLYVLDDLAELIALCGFRVRHAGHWNVYERTGLARVYNLLSRLPSRYCREKFLQTIFLVAEKTRDVTELPCVPRVYDPRGDWEFIARPASDASDPAARRT